ncbi:MAG: response regulator [Deltaproteobacteria bacterium]|nr:MAG: response regulator [Deltaproteobacteria bacterium]
MRTEGTRETRTMQRRSVLYIEDNSDNRALVRRLLEDRGYRVLEAIDGLSGIQKAIEEHPDLILMDINIPGLDGYEATTKLKGTPGLQDVPIVAVTGNTTHGDRERTLIAGCDGYISKPIDVETFTLAIEEFFAGKREQLDRKVEEFYFKEYREKLVSRLEEQIRALEAKNLLLEEQRRQLEVANRKLREAQEEMENTYVAVMQSLQRALEAKHPYTAGHSERVLQYATMVGEKLELTPEEIMILQRGAALHDIGKLVIDLSSINKPDRLTAEEWEEMRRHPEVGHAILCPLTFLREPARIVRHHHERLDGTGFPDGLKGEEIDTLTHIVIVCDAFDAMTSCRPYQPNRTPAQAFEELRRNSGTQFRPDIVETFIEEMTRPGNEARVAYIRNIGKIA